MLICQGAVAHDTDYDELNAALRQLIQLVSAREGQRPGYQLFLSYGEGYEMGEWVITYTLDWQER